MATALILFHLIHMYTNTVFSAAFCAVPGLTTPISCPSTIQHVLVSQEPSSGVHAVASKALHCQHTDHMVRTLAQTNYFYRAQNLAYSQQTHARDITTHTRMYRGTQHK
jgi:hypothetical protein